MSAKAPRKNETDEQRLIRVLEDIGYSASPDEFKIVAEKFKHDAVALDALRDGVERHGEGEDSGSYAESASSGYHLYAKKRNALEAIQKENDLAFLEKFNVTARPGKGPSTPERELYLEMIQSLTASTDSRTEALFRKAFDLAQKDPAAMAAVKKGFEWLEFITEAGGYGESRSAHWDFYETKYKILNPPPPKPKTPEEVLRDENAELKAKLKKLEGKKP